MEYLYHYTAPQRWEQIKESGYLKLTPSNLLKPKNPKMVKQADGTYVYADETDSYKPVVWFTNLTTPEGHGLIDVKTEIQIAVELKKEKHIWWVEWKDKNRMNKSWFKSMTKGGMRYGSWYVCEEIVPIEDFIYVKNLKTGEVLYGEEPTE